MTIKEKKRILRSYRKLDEYIERLRRERERSCLCDTYSGPLGSDEGARGGSSGTVVEIAVEKRDVDYESLIKTELEKMYRLRIKIEHSINMVNNGIEQRVLRLYHLGKIDEYGERRYLTFTEIATKLCYSERQIYRIYKAALLHLPDIEL